MYKQNLEIPRWKRILRKTASILAAVTMIFNFGAANALFIPQTVEASTGGYSFDLITPTPPATSDTFTWTFSGSKPGQNEVSHLTVDGCWAKADINQQLSSVTEGTLVFNNDGSVKIDGLQDNKLPVDLTLVFNETWGSTGSTDATVKAGPTELDPISSDGPNCQTPAFGTIKVRKDVRDQYGNDISDNQTFYIQLNGDNSSIQPFSETVTAVYTVPVGVTQTLEEVNLPAGYDFVLFNKDEDASTPGAQITITQEDQIISVLVKNKQEPGVCKLVVNKTVDKESAVPGDTLTYTITYENQGTAFCTGGGVKIYDEFKNDAGKPGLTYVPGSAKIISITNDQDLHVGDPAPEVFANFNGSTIKLLGNLHEIGPLTDSNDIHSGEKGVIELKATVNSGDFCDSWKVWNSGWTDGVEVQSDVQFQSEKTTVTTPCDGTLKVKKFVDSGNLTPDNWSFTVGNDTKSPAQGTNYVVFSLPAGTYTATESSVAGYHQVSSTCTNVQVVPNQQAVCEFHNAQDKGELTVIKLVEGSNELSSSWTMNVAGPTPLSFAGDANGTTHDVVAGNYSITETGPSGYTLTYSGDCDVNGNVSIADGQSKTCTLTNSRDKGSIEVHKAYDHNNDGIIDETDPANWTWNLDGVESGIPAGATRDLLTGINYTVSENDDVEYNSSWLCTINGNQYKEGLGTQTENLSVAKGDHIVCTFNNVRKFGDVTFEKVVNGGTALPSDWTFTVAGQGTYNHGETVSLPTGTYAVTENGPAGYTNTDISGICSPAAAAAGGTLVVTENGGTCTFENTQNTGRIVVYKNVDTDGDGQVDVTGATDWTWDIENGSQNIATGTGTGVDTGTYTISEDQKANFHVTNLTCDGQSYGATESGSVTVAKDQVVECTFTNTRDTGDLRIKKYEDVNGNGVKDANEPYLIGWDFTVSQNGQTVATGTTNVQDSNWLYIYGLPTGTYDVTETQKAGWINTEPGISPITKQVQINKNQLTSVWFGNFELGKIYGYKWNDVDASGDFSNGDTVLANWTICISGVGCTQTDSNGYYEFSGLTAGTYTVYETVLPGWYAVFPTTSHSVQIVSGDEKRADFYNFKYGSISGYKFEDVNANGVWDNGESALQGWEINLSGDATDQTTTDANGKYTFASLSAGTYSVTETQQAGWMQTTQNPAPITITSGYDATGANFGNFKSLTVSGHKFEDLNGDGNLADGVAIQGWTIYATNGQETRSTTTDANGYYSFAFDNTDAGDWTIYEANPAGWTQTYPASGDYDVTVQSGSNITDRDFGNFENVSISGHKFEDTNGNGTWDQGELALSGWTIQLLDTQDNILDTDITDSEGEYSFENLGPATFRVREVQQQDWIQTTTNPADITTVSGQDIEDIDFGNYEEGMISGYKFNDLNGNGIWDKPEEPAIEGWTIYISGNWATSTQTDEFGYYEFDGLTAGDWTVTEDETDSAWVRTTTNPAPIAVTSGTDETDINFGNFELGKISGYKFLDLNNDGEWADSNYGSEYGLENWTIYLRSDDNGQPGIVLDSTTTDSNGYYEFAGLTAGSYWLSEELKDGWYQYAPQTGTYGPIAVTSGYDNSQTCDAQLTSLDSLTIQTRIVPCGFLFGNAEKITLDVEKTADPKIIEATETISYRIDWSVAGDSIATNVVLVDTILSDELVINEASISDGGVWDANVRTITWDFGTQQPNASGFVTYDATVTIPIENGTELDNIARLSADNADPEYDEDDEQVIVTSYFDVTIDKDGPATAQADEEITYTVDWALTGTSPISTATITDTLPANTTFVSASNGGTENAGIITWDINPVAQGDSGQFTVTVKLDAPLRNGIEITNEAEICATAPNLDEKCDEDDTTTRVESDFDVTLEKTGPDSAKTGESITYTLAWELTGNAPVDELTITDVVPANTTFVSASDNGTENAGTVSWTLNNNGNGYLPGDTGSLTMTVTLDNPFPESTSVENTGNICGTSFTFTQEEILEHCDDDNHETFVPQMTIEKTVDIGNTLGFVNPGDTVAYTIVISSTGTEGLIDVELTDTLPEGFLYADTLTPSRTWNLGDIAIGDSVTTTYDVIVGNDVEAGFYDNIAVATADNHDPVDDDATVEVRVPTPQGETTEPILTIEKTVNAEFTNPGETLEYTVVITNSGDGQALDVVLTDSLPEGFTFIENGTSTMVWELGAIDPGASKTVTYKVFVGNDVKAGNYENLAIADASNHDPIKDSVAVEVRIPKVLAETVPNTGATPRDLVIFLASILMILSGALFIRQGKVYAARNEK